MSAGKLVNVRLNREDAAKAKDLQAAGVQLSKLLRDAIRAEHGRRCNGKLRKRAAKEILAEIYERYPVPDNLPPRNFDLTDRRAFSDFIRKRLRRRKPSA